MKHLFKLLSLIFVMTTLLVNTSCSKDDDDSAGEGDGGINRPELMYTWKMVTIENEGGLVSARREYEYNFSKSGNGYFNESTYINNMGSRTPNVPFTYTLSGDKLTITYPLGKPQEIHNISFSSDKNTLYLNSGAYKRL